MSYEGGPGVEVGAASVEGALIFQPEVESLSPGGSGGGVGHSQTQGSKDAG